MDKKELRLQTFAKPCHIVVDDTDGRAEELLSLCQDELARLEAKFSSYNRDSVISRLNQSAGTGSVVALDAESRSLFSYVNALWDESKHVFDPTTRVLQNCYNPSGKLLASPQQLQGMLKLVGWRHLELSDQGAHLSRKGMLVDLNSCIRPYAVDSLKRLLLKQNARHALLEIGQDIATIGKQPDGANWMVGVRFPKGARIAIARLKLNNKGYAMRGDSEKTTLHNGELFGRALSPVDGQPIPGLLCVAVVADNCLTACSAASVARLKTESSGIKWLDKLGMPWMAVDREQNCHGPLAPSH